jgi:hypothetical protein
MKNEPAYIAAKAARAILENEVTLASREFQAIPGIGSGPMGLTPDAIKASPEYCAAKKRFDLGFAALRHFNQTFVKTYAAEIRAERRAKRAPLTK